MRSSRISSPLPTRTRNVRPEPDATDTFSARGRRLIGRLRTPLDVQRYLNRHHSYLKSPVHQVYLVGDAQAVALAQRQFAELKQFTATPLDASRLCENWQHVGALPGPELAAALGTAWSRAEIV